MITAHHNACLAMCLLILATESSATLIVPVIFKDGLVVCADKRISRDATNTYTDDGEKLYKINSSALFSFSGSAQVEAGGKIAYAAETITQKFFSDNSLDGEK